MKISESLLDEIVIATIKKKAQIVLDCADISALRRKTVSEQTIVDCELALQQNMDERQTLYERLVLGEISREEYIKLREDSTGRMERYSQQLAAKKSEMEAGRISPGSIKAAKAAVSESAGNRELVETLIKSVRVFPDKQIDINWKISDFGITV
jgi:hypothetical protein